MGKQSKFYYNPNVMPAELSSEIVAEWKTLPPSLRDGMVRRFCEMRMGVAIHKDRAAGRHGRPMDGFFGLQILADKLHEHRFLGADAEVIDLAQAQYDELQTKLASDEEYITMVDQLKESFGPYMAQHGTTIGEYLRDRMTLEWEMRRDPLSGILMVCERVGYDPLMVMSAMQASIQQGGRA